MAPPSVGQAYNCPISTLLNGGQRSEGADLIKEISSDDKVIGCY